MTDSTAKHLEVLADALATPGEGRDDCPTCSGPHPKRRGWVPSDALHPIAAWKPCPDCQRDQLEER